MVFLFVENVVAVKLCLFRAGKVLNGRSNLRQMKKAMQIHLLDSEFEQREPQNNGKWFVKRRCAKETTNGGSQTRFIDGLF